MHIPKTRLLALLISLSLITSAHAQTSVPPCSASSALRQVDEYTLIADKHFVNDYSPRPNLGLVNVVVEIPSGTNAKWEVDKRDGQLKWEFRNGKPRVVEYLPYPGNYGMIPRTLLAKEAGGDGDPLDVLVLGPALPRGSVVETKIIGVLKLLDGGEQDDKLIAVLPGSELGSVDDIPEMTTHFKGVLDIVELWFANYKGPDKMESKGIGGAAEANALLDVAIKTFEATADRTHAAPEPTTFDVQIPTLFH